MVRLEKIFSLFSVLFATFVFLFLVYSVRNYAENYILQSCISSAGSDVVEYSPEIISLARNSESWYVLTDNEAKFALKKKFSKNQCSQLSSKPQDINEEKLKIAVKKTGEIIVWSSGFDNISGTVDDIVFPNGENVPQ